MIQRQYIDWGGEKLLNWELWERIHPRFSSNTITTKVVPTKLNTTLWERLFESVFESPRCLMKSAKIIVATLRVSTPTKSYRSLVTPQLCIRNRLKPTKNITAFAAFSE
jgi:hypothetical protein